MGLACFFLRKQIDRDDLIAVFRIIDTDQDGYITFAEFRDFIKIYLGLG